MGICQLKLKYVTAPGVSNVGDAKTFALDPAKAIPYLYALVAGKIEWAQGTIAGHPIRVTAMEQSVHPRSRCVQARSDRRHGILSGRVVGRRVGRLRQTRVVVRVAARRAVGAGIAVVQIEVLTSVRASSRNARGECAILQPSRAISSVG